MRLNEAPFNRRDAMDAEKDRTQSPEDMSLRRDSCERALLSPLLCAHHVSAVALSSR
jgi:hypothetical protein